MRKLILRLGEPAYHRGYADGSAGRPSNVPRFFRGSYQFGYDYGYTWTNPITSLKYPFTADILEAMKDESRKRQADWKRKYA